MMLLLLAVGGGCSGAIATSPSYDELLELTRRQALQLRALQDKLAELQPAEQREPPPRPQPWPLPSGPYITTCKHCVRFDDSLWCDCLRNTTVETSTGPATVSKWEQSALSLSACREGANASITAQGGFLSCDWRATPPPRVGNLTAGSMSIDPTTGQKVENVSEQCRYIPTTSFVSPEFMAAGDPLATHNLSTLWPWHSKGSDEERDVESEQEGRACCKLCREHSGCKGWTVTTAGASPPCPPCLPCPDPSKPCSPCPPPCPPPVHGHRVCHLVSQTSTATASVTSYSGYPIVDDSVSWCQNNQDKLNRGVPRSVRCGTILPHGSSHNASDFPRAWKTEGLPDGTGHTRTVQRGQAWLFYPCGNNVSCLNASSCTCSHRQGRGQAVESTMVCKGPKFDDAMQAEHIAGKKWAVFVHGGEFNWGSNIDQGYAILAAKVAAGGIGVLAVDYRTSPGPNLQWDGTVPPNNNTWPAAVNDIIQALEWLTLMQASEVSIFGDSSGGTQVMQTLLMLSHRRKIGNPSLARVFSAVTFSAWLDLTCSNPGYRTEAYCGMGNCLDEGSPDSGMHTAGWDSVKGQCAAISYAGAMPISHPLISPAHAGVDLLGEGSWYARTSTQHCLSHAWTSSLFELGADEDR